MGPVNNKTFPRRGSQVQALLPTCGSSVRIPAGMTIRKLTLLSVDGRAVWQSAGAFSGTVSIPMRTLPAAIYYLEAATSKDLKVLEIIRR